MDDYQQDHYQVLWNNQLNRNWDLSFAGNYTRGRGFFELYQGGASFARYQIEPLTIGGETIESSDLIERRWLDNDFYFGSAAANYGSDNKKLNVNLGSAFSVYNGDHFGEVIWARFSSSTEQDDRYYENDAQKTDFNIFSKASYQLAKKLTGFVDLQYRRVDYEFEGFDNTGNVITQNVDFNFFNPKLGLTYELNPQTSIYVYTGIGNKEPNRSDFVDTSPSSRPEHETVIDTEVGFKKTWQKGAIEANLYYLNYDNQLILTGQINDVGEYARINAEDSFRAGLELVAGYQLTKQFDISSSLTLSRNRIRSFNEFIDSWDTGEQVEVEHGDTDLALSPNVLFNAYVNFDALPAAKNHDLTFGLGTKFVGDQFIDNTSNQNTSLPSYSFTDFKITYKVKTSFAKEIALKLLVRNIFDAQYISSAWTYRYISEFYDGRPDDPSTRLEQGSTYNLTGYYPQAGRNFLLGLTLGF